MPVLCGRGEPAGGEPPAARRCGRAAGVRVLLLAALLLGCAPGADRQAGSGAGLYVANAHDGTVSAVIPSSSTRLGAPLPAPAPAAPQAWQLAAGRGGRRLLSVGGGSTHGGAVTLTGRDGGEWWTRTLALEPQAAAILLSGDGDRYGLVAYGEGTIHTRAPASACDLALVDLGDGAIVGRATACAAGETVSSLYLQHAEDRGAGATSTEGAAETRGGLRALVGVWSPKAGGRVIVLDPQTGHTLQTTPVPGVPTGILVGEDLVHVWLGVPPAEPWQSIAEADLAAPGSVLTLGDSSLRAESLVRLAEEVTSPALGAGPRSGTAYGLANARRTLVAVDLATGAVRRLADLPATGSSVTVADGKVFVAVRERNSLAVYDLARSASLPPVPTGRGPFVIAQARA
jgi:hypothetical protein